MNAPGQQGSSMVASALAAAGGAVLIGAMFLGVWIAWRLSRTPEAPRRSEVIREVRGPAAQTGERSRAEDHEAPRPALQPVVTAQPVEEGPPRSDEFDSGPPPISTGSVAEGDKLFRRHCAPCHQSEGLGLVGVAPSIGNPYFLALASDDFLRQTIAQGRPGTAMAGWAHLGKGSIDDLVAYLRSGEDPDLDFPVSVDPARKHPGEAGNGKALYAQHCASCHGANATGYGEGAPGLAIGNRGFLQVASDDYLFQTVKHGRPGTPMRPFGGPGGTAILSDQQIADIIAHLRGRAARSR